MGDDLYTRSRRLFVGNLAPQTTWQDLKDHFRDWGCPVSYVKVEEEPGRFTATGRTRGRGWGIVEFPSVQEAQQAIDRVDSTWIDMRQITLREDRNANDLPAQAEGGKGKGKGKGRGKSQFKGSSYGGKGGSYGGKGGGYSGYGGYGGYVGYDSHGGYEDYGGYDGYASYAGYDGYGGYAGYATQSKGKGKGKGKGKKGKK